MNRQIIKRAISNLDLETIKLCIKENNAINSFYSQSNDTLLHLVLQTKADINFIISLIPYCISIINKRNRFGRQPLHEACAIPNQTMIISELIKYGADIEGTKRGDWTPLMCICHSGTLDQLKLLLEKGANIQRRNSEGWTCFQIACQNSNEQLSMHLLNSFAIEKREKIGIGIGNYNIPIDSEYTWKSVAYNGRSALFTAALHGHYNTVRIIINKIKDYHNIAIRQEHGVTLLDNAKKSENQELIDYLKSFIE